MPSKTFLNLPKAKKVKFIKQSLIEFSNYQLKDASINRIIKACDIARGSFYQYFKDINDLYRYIFDISFEKLENSFEELLEKTKSMSKTFTLFYDTLIDYGSQKSNRNYFANVFRNATAVSVQEYYNKKKQEYIGKIIQNIDKKSINKTSKEEFLYSLELVYYEIIHSATKFFIYNEGKKTNQAQFKKNIDILLKKIGN